MKDPDHPEPALRSPAITSFLSQALRHVRISGEVFISVLSAKEMQQLNRRFRGKNKATDVLSFPAENSFTGASVGGDIAICSDIAKQNAKLLGHSLEDELKILLLHGLLHLAGHDHESDHGEMAVLEQKLRAKLKLPTGLIERTGRKPALKRKIKFARLNPRMNAGASTQKSDDRGGTVQVVLSRKPRGRRSS